MYSKAIISKQFIFTIFLVSCGNKPNYTNATNKKIGNNMVDKVDTLKIESTIINVEPKIFETAYFQGTQAKEDSSVLLFYAIDIGKINVESGKIIACDPIVMYNEKPFSQIFPIGKFPVQLSIAKIKNDQRIAFSRILFSKNPVVKWEFAMLKGQKQISVFGKEMYSYSVDGGIGLFIDEKANMAFSKENDEDKSLWGKVFNEETEKHSHENWSYVLYEFNNHNLAAFSTGYGDGHYSTYIGFDKDGHPCRLLTDFYLVNWAKIK